MSGMFVSVMRVSLSGEIEPGAGRKDKSRR